MDVDITIKNYRCFSDEQPAHISLRKGFTAFVGVNNAGKSSLLKFFYEFRPLFKFLSRQTMNLVEALQRSNYRLELMPLVLDENEIFCNTNDRALSIHFAFGDVQQKDDSQVPTDLIVTLHRTSLTSTFKVRTHFGWLNFASEARYGSDTTIYVNSDVKIDFDNVYQAFRALSEVMYIGPFSNAIALLKNDSYTSTQLSFEDYFDIDVGPSFIRSWRELKTGNARKKRENADRVTEDIRKIFGFKRLEMNTSADAKSLQILTNGKSYNLLELGSGLAQFVVVFANAIMKRPSYILIDEPELNLHPSLQLDFLTTLGSYASEGVLFATHSLGLARSSAEQVYSVQKNPAGYSEVLDYAQTPRLAEFVGELSFAGYRELGFDKILLVEGPSELKTIQQFLRSYGLDHQIVLLPMGGAQMNADPQAQLTEIKRISENVFALIDSERPSADAPLDPKRQAFFEACNATGVTCHILERRATENYLTDRAVKKVKGENYRALAPHESLKEANQHWRKSENWLIAREMMREELNGTDLGQFLASLQDNKPE